MNFLINGVERRIGMDLNGDGYVGGEGFLSKLERKTHIDFNGDNIIGRPYDIPYHYHPMYTGGYTGYPSMGGYQHYPSFHYAPQHFGYF